ncbi:hypothetical protein Tco_1379847 [Tanacetum coccineum]
MFYLLPGKDLDSGLRSLKSDAAVKECDDLEDDLYDYFSKDDSDTTYVDHFSDGVDHMPDGKNYLKTFCVCFNGVKQGWLQGCRRIMGLDGCFLKTICKGEVLSAVGRDGSNKIYPIAWAVVSVENKEN